MGAFVIAGVAVGDEDGRYLKGGIGTVPEWSGDMVEAYRFETLVQAEAVAHWATVVQWGGGVPDAVWCDLFKGDLWIVEV